VTWNAEFVFYLVNTLHGEGQSIGIYSSHRSWPLVMGVNNTDYGDKSGIKLWYAHWDNKTSFDDYPSVAFGGWTQPNTKQFVGDSTLCDVGPDLDYRDP
jgi:hypothetical protein